MRAIITGAGGQDARHLSDYLLGLGWEVIGVVRRSSQPRNYLTPLQAKGLKLIEGDITDMASMGKIIRTHSPDHFYNLAAQSHVGTSFEQPLYTIDVTGKAVAELLEILRAESPNTRFYQASSSEMFGKSVSFKAGYATHYTEDGVACGGVIYKDPQRFQDEKTIFTPQSPYAIAKLMAHHFVRLYRECYGMFACSGILFNHEGEHRSLTFVTRKITNYVARLKLAKEHNKDIGPLHLGNLDASRDWSYAGDLVKAMHLILSASQPDDFVVGSGETHTVREFCQVAFSKIGEDWAKHVVVDEQFKRPAEVDFLRARPDKIKAVLGWAPEHTFEDLVNLMIDNDIKRCETKFKIYGDI